MSLEMAGFSENGNGLNSCTSQKRQRTSEKTEGKIKQTATLLDLDVIDCPVCFETLTIHVLQCENGHIACSTCCEKLRKKCATCSLPIHSRNRAMERVLELLRVPCPNEEFGCSASFSYTERSTHVKQCVFTQRACPFTSCDYIGSFKDLYEHSVAKHCKSSYTFDCGTHLSIHPLKGERVILKERTTNGQKEGEVVVVECFNTPQGRILYASCIGPGTEKLYYNLKLVSSGGDFLYFNSVLSRVGQVSNEPPDGHFMSVPSYMCPYKLQIAIKRERCIRRKTTTISSLISQADTLN